MTPTVGPPKSNSIYVEPPSNDGHIFSGPMVDPPATSSTSVSSSLLSGQKVVIAVPSAITQTSSRSSSPPKTGVSSMKEVGSALTSDVAVISAPVQIPAPTSPWTAAPPLEGDLVICSENGNLTTELNSLAQWPTHVISKEVRTKRSQLTRESGTHSRCDGGKLGEKMNYKAEPTTSHHPPLAQEDKNRRFPWAARMNPSMWNLHRATSPTYLEDETPHVSIPSHVKQGLENQKEFILGQFYRCSTPPEGLIHAVINQIWGRKCRIFIRKLGDSSYLFHIPYESTRSWVLQCGLWHVDECLMFVALWSPTSTLSMPDISTVPIWVTLKNIPSQLYSISGISYIASGLGAPMATYKPRLDPTLMGEAKIMVEVELDKPFLQRIAAADNKGLISMVDVVYSWIPTKCGRCGHLGHKESRCLQRLPKPQANTTLEILQSTTEVIPILVSNIDSSIVSAPLLEATTAIANVHSTSLETNVEPAIKFISTTSIVEVPLQDLESSTIVELLTTTFKSYEVVSDTETTPPPASVISEVNTTVTTEVVLAPISTNVATTQEAIAETISPTLDVHYLESNSSGSKTIPLIVEPSVCGSLFRADEAITTPESSDTDDIVTPSTQRILRERPVLHTLKYNEDEWISVSTHRRGKCSRGGRRGRYD